VQAKLFIDAHYAERLDLESIADESFFSKFHFMRLFKNIYGKTPHQYLTQVRIVNAKVCLEKGTEIKEVCFSVGFESASSFTGLFKRLMGMTPSQYQQSLMERNEQMRTMPLQFVPNCFIEVPVAS